MGLHPAQKAIIFVYTFVYTKNNNAQGKLTNICCAEISKHCISIYASIFMARPW
jgi:hypothetical protein